MNNKWLWLSKAFNSQPQKMVKLYRYFGNIEEIWGASESEIGRVSGISLQVSKKILQNKSESVIKEVERLLLEKNIKWISIDQSEYPKCLKEIYDPPSVLYYRGDLPDNSKISIGIVGTREASIYGRMVAERMGKELSENNIQVISGMARGIDTFAHAGALIDIETINKAKTFAVLGCGLDLCFPSENRNLMRQIIQYGGVISEYLPGTPPQKHAFPLRNRIISGIANGIVIVEAAKKSGSLITADYALEHGKDIFAVPGRIFDDNCIGSNELIKQGAKPVFTSKDIIEEYFELDYKQLEFNVAKVSLNEQEKIIYDMLSFDPLSVDTIVEMTQLKYQDILMHLFSLETKGCIKNVWGQGYIRVIET